MAEVRSEATCTGRKWRKSNVSRCPQMSQAFQGFPNHCHHGNQHIPRLRCHSTQNATMSSGSAVILPPICTQPLPHLGRQSSVSEVRCYGPSSIPSPSHVHPMSIPLSTAPSGWTGEGLPNPAAFLTAH